MNRLGHWFLPIFLLIIVFAGVLFIPSGECNCLKTSVHPDDPQNFFTLKNRRVSGLDIAGKFKGLLEYIPAYDPKTESKFPLIIFFHGNGATGNGTETGLCRILYDGTNAAGAALPALIEKGKVPVVEYNNKRYEFMVISAQLEEYLFPVDYPDADDVDELINYILATYPQVDSNRIYLTGISSGANIVIEYISSSINHANRIAAASIASLCSYVDTDWNRDHGLLAENIGKANLPVWFVQAENDDKNCPPEIPMGWIKKIEAAGGTKTRITLLHNRPDGDPGLRETRLTHNTWFRLYDPELVDKPNQYDWFIQYSRRN